MVCRPLPTVFLASALALPALAHEFWIEPLEFQVETGTPLGVHLRVGEEFYGAPQAYFENRADRFELRRDGTVTPYDGRLGDIPAMEIAPSDDGLLVVLHQTAPSTLTYESWEKFQAFADHKDFPNIRERHLARGLPLEEFDEAYTRHAKSLIAVGGGAGSDRPSGMEVEFVALTNPYTDNLTDGLAVQLLFQNTPHADAQIEVFDRAPDGTVAISLRRTDADGQALIPVTPGHSYLLDAVYLRPYDGPEDAVWESLWASLSFHVP